MILEDRQKILLCGKGNLRITDGNANKIWCL
jgi:hypothetical protein